jgi:hypothetical protein
MIIKGTSCAGARRLAVHLTRRDTNERVEVKEIRGVAAEDLRGALLEMEALAAGARTTKPFYHSSINTLAKERMTDDQRWQAIDQLEAALGLTGQPRVVVIHEKKDREHCHIVWSRLDLERMAVISDSHNFRKHEQVARDLEREFGHERVQGAHVEREGKERPKRTPSHAEMLQAERTGMSPKEVKEQITGIWQATETGKAFAAGLAEQGYVLARGDRRDFVVIDPMGGTHSLSRRIEGAKAKDVRERMADIDAGQLPDVSQAKQIQKARADLAAEQEQDKPKTSGGTEQDWTQHGGMVEQQRSALDWVKETAEHKKAKVEQTDRMRERPDSKRETTDRDRLRQALARQFGRELEEGFQNEIDGGGRERTRG